MKKDMLMITPSNSLIKIINRSLMVLTYMLVFFVTAQAQQKYLVKGKIEGFDKEMKIMLAYSEGTKYIRDSAITKDGSFIIQGTISRPYKVSIFVRSVEPEPLVKVGQIIPAYDVQAFYLSAGTTTIEGKNLRSSVINNPVQNEYNDLQNQLQPVTSAIYTNNRETYLHKNNTDSVSILKEKKQALIDKIFQIDLAFIRRHPDSYISYDLVVNNSHVIENPVVFNSMLNALAPQFKSSAEWAKMAQVAVLAKKFAIGQPIMEFTQTDVNGKSISLSSLKGKYVLVDFWASWCGPCRMEYPYIHTAYNRFKNKNFEVIGISLDDKKDLWINAIKDNHFDWVEVCDLKGRKNDIAVAYGISAIPQSFLVDPNGIIIAKNLRGDDLIEKLKDVIKTNN